MKKDTADLLCHSVRTAENSYLNRKTEQGSMHQ